MKIDMKYVKDILFTEDEEKSIRKVLNIVEKIADSLDCCEILLEDGSPSYSYEDVEKVIRFLNGMDGCYLSIERRSEVEE